MRIGITYLLKTDFLAPGKPFPVEDAWEELDSPQTVEAIREVLVTDGHEVFPLGGDLRAIEKIKRWGIDFVFNLAEGVQGRSREAHIPALLEMRGIPYSGSDPLALALTLDKALTKRIALSLGIATPDFWVLQESREIEKVPDRFPLFVKPVWEGSSKGVRLSSRVEDRAELETEANRIFENYPAGTVLVEEYIAGREFTVGILGNGNPEILGVMEIAFRDPSRKDFCYSLEVKRNWRAEVEYHVPPRIPPSLEEAVGETARQLFVTLGLRDMARFDFRLDPDNRFYFLEVNPLPGLSPESGDLVLLARKKGWSYGGLILTITRCALSRYPHLRVLSHVETH